MWKVYHAYSCKYTIENHQENRYEYLWQDGIIHNNHWSSAKVGEKGCFGSKKSAQEFLDNWLKEKDMSIDSKIEQCEKDIEALQKNLVELKNSKNVFRCGVYEKDGRKYLLGFSWNDKNYLTLYSDDGHYMNAPFACTWVDVPNAWKLNDMDANYMRTFTYVGNL